MKLTTKTLIVLLVSVLAVVLFTSVVKAGSALDELKTYLQSEHRIYGQPYSLTSDEVNAIIYAISSNGASEDAIKSALSSLQAAENAAKSVSNASDLSGAINVNPGVRDAVKSNVMEAVKSVGLTLEYNDAANYVAIKKADGGLVVSGSYRTDENGNIERVTSSGNTNVVGIKYGANRAWVVANENPTFEFDIDYSFFENGGKVLVKSRYDKEFTELDPSNYTSRAGSTIIELTHDYANSLDKDWYQIRVEFTNGKYATTGFLPSYEGSGEGGAGGSADANVGAISSPVTYSGAFVYTGSNNVLYIALSMLAVVAISVAFVKKVNER